MSQQGRMRLSSRAGNGGLEGDEAAIIFGFEGFRVGGKHMSLGCFRVSIAAAAILEILRFVLPRPREGGKIWKKNFSFF